MNLNQAEVEHLFIKAEPPDGSKTKFEMGSHYEDTEKAFHSHLILATLKDITSPMLVPSRLEKESFVTLESLEKEIRHKCQICGKGFKKSAHFNQHVNSHSDPVDCNMCSERFYKIWDLKMHKKRHHTSEKLFPCQTCDKIFMDQWRLNKHNKIHTGLKPHICLVCNKQFTESGNLVKHMKTHNKEKAFLCDLCPKRYAQKKDLQGHMTVHIVKNRFQCVMCSVQFDDIEEKRAHMRMHVNTKSYKCTTCEKSYTQFCDLKYHTLTHGERSNECRYCTKKFFNSGSLRKHEKLHNKEGYCRCDICDRSFSQVCNMKRHVERVHFLDGKFICLNCPIKFDDPTELRDHLPEHKNQLPYKCNFCSKAFSANQSLANHVKLHRNHKRHIKEFLSVKHRKSSPDSSMEDPDLSFEEPEINESEFLTEKIEDTNNPLEIKEEIIEIGPTEIQNQGF